MPARTFKQLFEEAEKQPGFWKELAIIEFTEELVRAMDEQGVSRSELARRTGTSPAYITKVLRGNANFTLGSMTKLAMALGLELKMHLAPRGAATSWRDKLETRRLEDVAPGAGTSPTG